MSKNAMIILIMVSALVFLGVGFAVGNAVYASLNGTPAGETPAMESWVDQRIAALQSKINEQKTLIDSLRAELDELAAKVGGDEPNPPENSTKVKITGNSVNLRSSPSNASPSNIVGAAYNGDVFDYLGTTEKDANNFNWYKIRVSGIPGVTEAYVRADLAYLLP
ncbi:MAG: SH3 domain-containing protein [Clostridiales bacterium]|nr:SH3 domain-containing protein [Clostridiales bacterium]